MPGPAAVVSVDDLLSAIVQPDAERQPELEMVHTQVRLLVANYLKNGYDVVVEGSFVYGRDGSRHNAEPEIDQLVALMRNLTEKAAIVRLAVDETTLRRRGEATGREAEVETAIDMDAAYESRTGDRFLSFDSGMPIEAMVKSLSDYFQAESSPSRLRPPTVQ
jgi:hypothetical protein